MTSEVRLSREMRLLDVTMIGVGAMIGAGIFVLTGIAAGVAGPALLVGLARSAFLSVVAALALWELNFAREIVLAAFLIGFGAIGVAFALGVGIGSARAIQAALSSVLSSRGEK